MRRKAKGEDIAIYLRELVRIGNQRKNEKNTQEYGKQKKQKGESNRDPRL